MSGAQKELDLPVQPVNKPILCSPFAEPTEHWVYKTDTGEPYKQVGRRSAMYWYKDENKLAGSGQRDLFGHAQEQSDDLPLVNALRADVKRWREKNYEGATPVTRQLLAHWSRPDRARGLFFCQLEAVETVIYLQEILDAGGRLPAQNMALAKVDYERLKKGEKTTFETERKLTVPPRLLDKPNEDGFPGLLRYGCKMATGSGKTVVMSMLIAWTLCNRGRNPANRRYPSAVLVVCPNLTIKERLQVLRPDHPENYYQAFEIVPSQLVPEMMKGRVMVTNWHAFAPESPHSEGGKSYVVVDKGEESPEAFARRALGDLHDRGPILVLNDEAHHAYRPAPVDEGEKLSTEDKAEREEATVWVSGLDRINRACGVKLCVDLSATPFYLHGSGYVEGAPFPWLVSDFGLVDAIESGIVKIPRLPVSDTTGRPEPKFFRLWKQISENLAPGEKLPGGKPKPEVVWREAQDALLTLASQWKERFVQVQSAKPGQEHVPPVMIVVCDNTDIASIFARNISGEEVMEVVTPEDANDDEDAAPAKGKRKTKQKEKKVYGESQVFPEFANGPGALRTLRIDSKLLSEAESEDPAKKKSDAAEELREIVSSVGKPGKPGEQVRCVVSVQMLSEGWDANNVTHILGLRAFHSQLLCEQVIGRGLRRMDYTVDPETGLLTEEYVDVYGVPFSIIPFKGRKSDAPAPEDKPKNHVHAVPERKVMEIRFPVVEGYAFALRGNMIRADVASMEPVHIQPDRMPTAVFVKPQVGYQTGGPTMGGGFLNETQDREEYYASNHLQTIQFEITRRVVWALTEGVGGAEPKLKLRARHQLFPQVFRLVDEYVEKRVQWNGQDKRELGLELYVQRIVERMIDAIEPDDAKGEPPLLPILNRYKPIGSTAEVNYKTTKPCVGTQKSHINQVVLDTKTWESSAAFRLEQKNAVSFYARNDHMEFVVPYEYQGISRSYVPDFLVRLANGVTLVLEIKGWSDDEDNAKHQAARRWVSAVNNWGKLGRWAFHVCRNPQILGNELEEIVRSTGTVE